MHAIDTHYPIAAMEMRAFWDVCKHFSTHFPEFSNVRYTIEGEAELLLLEETDFAWILRKFQGREQQVHSLQARFYLNDPERPLDPAVTEIGFKRKSEDAISWGLSVYAEGVGRDRYYAFEELIFESFTIEQGVEDWIAFGQPCELLAMVVDIRGFSAFCEQPNIESPYTCGLMSAFYKLIEQSLCRYPPNMLKFMGDGVLAVWETQANSRDRIIQVAFDAAMGLEERWQAVCKSPRFSLGAPEHTGVGISLGLASRLVVGNDYLGRPINIASRLCRACPEDRIFVDHAVPALPSDWKKEEVGVMIKPFGRYQVRAFFKKDRPKGMPLMERY